MSVTSDIKASYRGPGRVVTRLLGQGRREAFALNILIFACIVFFVAQAPYQSREAHLNTDVPLMARMYWSAFLWIFIVPLVLYAFAALIHGLARLAGRPITGYGIRLSMFWALLASAPMTLLLGLTAAFMGESSALQLVALLWLINVLWFWIAGMRAAEGVAL
ncbi:YIP1 family protein [Pseudosulfitobacter sp. SM2401]|jgi:hypothetical protein|uniref:YIP1 family protein n=1 Tax=Pseudosulfitobacter sp. SM2401 TaxID=3350098 RepID=UPI0036F44611